MYTCTYFKITELVPRHVYADRGEAAWELLDERALRTLDDLRKKFGRTTVNNWRLGGTREWSGLRTPESPYGGPYSQHRLGQAFDCVFAHRSSEEVREYVLAHPEEFPHIRGVEKGVSWFHYDVGNRRGNEIVVFGA